MYKRWLIESLLHRSFRLCSNYENFHPESKNNYLQNFLNQCIHKFLNKLFIQKDLNFMVTKRELAFVLINLGKTSLDLRTRLRRTINETYNIVN